jgi:hypothetical protein
MSYRVLIEEIDESPVPGIEDRKRVIYDKTQEAFILILDNGETLSRIARGFSSYSIHGILSWAQEMIKSDWNETSYQGEPLIDQEED